MIVEALTADDLASPSLRAGISIIAREFMAEAKYPVPFNEEHFFTFWTGLLASNVGAFYVSYKDLSCEITGVMGALFWPDSFSGLMTGAESFWFVQKEHRSGRTGLRLFQAFENECKRRECKMNLMIHLEVEGMRGDALSEFYLRRGYTPAESFFRKVN